VDTLPLNLPSLYVEDAQLPYDIASLLTLKSQIEELHLQREATVVCKLFDQGIHRILFYTYAHKYEVEVAYDAEPDKTYTEGEYPPFDVDYSPSEIRGSIDWLIFRQVWPSNGELTREKIPDFLKAVYGEQYAHYEAEQRAIALRDAASPAQPSAPSKPKF
jgi:hypothetical protein